MEGVGNCGAGIVSQKNFHLRLRQNLSVSDRIFIGLSFGVGEKERPLLSREISSVESLVDERLTTVCSGGQQDLLGAVGVGGDKGSSVGADGTRFGGVLDEGGGGGSRLRRAVKSGL